MRQIFEYNDYRLFLKDYYKEKKKTCGYFTYRYFAKIADFSSPVFIKLVIDGKSNLRLQSIKKLANAINLNNTESKYFTALVQFNQAKTVKKKKEYYVVLRMLNKEYGVQVLDSSQYDYYTKWFHSVLRELAPNIKGKADPKTLGKLVIPPLKARETKEAIKLLLKNGLLEEKVSGTYQQPKRMISTGSDIVSMAVRELHVQMAQQAKSAIEDIPREERDISGLTMGMSLKTFEQLKKEIKLFREKIRHLIAEDESVERVYRLNLQLFPLSKKIEPDQGEQV